MADEKQGLKKFDKTLDIKTYKVGSEIVKIIKKYNVIPASIDFDITGVSTFVKEPGQDEFNALNEIHQKSLAEVSYLLSEDLKITQEYIVKFKPLVQDPNFRPVVSIVTDSLKCIAKATVKKNSILKYSPELKDNLVNYFNKLKVKNGMLIHINDKAMLSSIDGLVELVKNGKFNGDHAVWLAKWPKAVKSVDDSLELRYLEKNKKEIDEDEQVDYADRNFIVSVIKDEVLVVYKKAKNGKPGRSYSGTYIDVDEPNINNIPNFEPDKASIIIEDNDDEKIYKAAEDGFVIIDKGLLSVQQEMKLKNIALKQTGHVKPGIDSHVKIRVESGDPAEDAVGPDMIIEATEIKIIGSVGAGAILRAKKIVVNGQTHQTTKLYAEDLEVAVLKGYAEANIASIKSIENGTIYGDSVTIDMVVGGNINGRRVDIKELRSPARICAAQAILLEKVNCGESKLYLDQTAVLPAKEAITDAKQGIKDSNKTIKEDTAEMIKVSKYIRDNKGNFANLKESIMDAKKRGEAPNPTFLKLFKEYLEKMKSLDEIQKKLEAAEETVEKSKKLLSDLDGQLMNAFVFNEGLKWKGRSEVHFIFHGKVFDADKVIDNFPDAEMIGVKLSERDGLSAVVGSAEDFPRIDIFTEQPFDYKSDPLAPKDEDKDKDKQESKEEGKKEVEEKEQRKKG